jgi:hypothetical protein
MVKDGVPFRLNGPSSLGAGAGYSDGAKLGPVITEVRADWGFDAWLKQNEKSPFVIEGLIALVDENKAPAAEAQVPNGT